MIRLGLRLAVSGGRDAVGRLAMIAAAVAVGVGMVLTTLAGLHAVGEQNDRYAWLATGSLATAAPTDASSGVWFREFTDEFRGANLIRVDLAAMGTNSPVPPGMDSVPGPGQYVASPALVRLLARTPAAQLGNRFPGRLVGTLGRSALPSPDALVVVLGRTPALMRQLPGATRVGGYATTSPSDCGGCGPGLGVNENAMDLMLAVITAALLFPVLVFVGSATRLSAARREQRFTAMRLVGATPGQIAGIAAVESALAAALGTAAGFGVFFLLRPLVAGIPFTGAPFFTDDLALEPAIVVAVALGVPVVAAATARLALRRVIISPLGVARRVTPAPPRARRLWLLVLGVAELTAVLVVGRPDGSGMQALVYLGGILAVMAGLVVAGPWLTLLGSRLVVRRAARADTLIAGRRLADDPHGSYRAVSGLVLGLFVGTVAVAVITTFVHERGNGGAGPASRALVKEFIGGPDGGRTQVARLPAELVPGLTAVTGVSGVAVVHSLDPGRRFGPGVVACADLRRVGEVGRCAAGAQAARVPFGVDVNSGLSTTVWPTATVPAARLTRLPVQAVVVGTDGSAAAIEAARTLLENADPSVFPPSTIGELSADTRAEQTAFERLADIVMLASLPIAGCSLAASVVAGLADRRRPFSLLRLTGVSVATLRRVVALETVVPLVGGAVVAVGFGFLAAELFLRSQLGYTVVAPGASFWLVVAAGVVLALLVVASTLPFLRRATGPAAARND